MAKDTQEVSDGNGPVGEPEPALRGGGLPLPGLRHWRKRRGMSQAELARRADLSSDYLFKIESGRRACRPETGRGGGGEGASGRRAGGTLTPGPRVGRGRPKEDCMA